MLSFSVKLSAPRARHRNADALHLASCAVAPSLSRPGCRCDRQGDDGLNVHGQYALAQACSGCGASEIQLVGPHQNGDKTTWGSLFSRPVFRVGDRVAVRRAGTLAVAAALRIESVRGMTEALRLTLSGSGLVVRAGDVIEPLDALPSSVRVEDSSFSNSRASGIILQTNNAVLRNNSVGSGLVLP
jgi:hypothetical protein